MFYCTCSHLFQLNFSQIWKCTIYIVRYLYLISGIEIKMWFFLCDFGVNATCPPKNYFPTKLRCETLYYFRGVPWMQHSGYSTLTPASVTLRHWMPTFSPSILEVSVLFPWRLFVKRTLLPSSVHIETSQQWIIIHKDAKRST